MALAGASCELKVGRLAFDSDDEAFRCADDPGVASVPVLSALLNPPGEVAGWGRVAGSRSPWDDSGPSMVIVSLDEAGTELISGSLDGLCFPVMNSKIARPLVRRQTGTK